MYFPSNQFWQIDILKISKKYVLVEKDFLKEAKICIFKEIDLLQKKTKKDYIVDTAPKNNNHKGLQANLLKNVQFDYF